MNQTITIILGLTLPCLLTTLGAALIFFFKSNSPKFTAITVGLAAGIMLSASIWSLLVPALSSAEEIFGSMSFLPVVLGFIFGSIFMIALDYACALIFSRRKKNFRKNLKNYAIFRQNLPKNQQKFDFFIFQGKSSPVQKHRKIKSFTSERTKSFKIKHEKTEEKQRAFKLFMAITIHNIPEGLSVGFAIGTAIALKSQLIGAVMFAIGIALQNFPEGLATALPIQKCLKNKPKAFFFAFLSGFVEPIFAIFGFLLSAYITSLLPWLLAFSAGAMIYVIVEEMIPEIHTDSRISFGTWAFVLGFVVMMLLDICL